MQKACDLLDSDAAWYGSAISSQQREGSCEARRDQVNLTQGPGADTA